MTALESSQITFRQTLNFVSIVYRIQNIDNDAIRVEFYSESVECSINKHYISVCIFTIKVTLFYSPSSALFLLDYYHFIQHVVFICHISSAD